jgi:hypothetical protein
VAPPVPEPEHANRTDAYGNRSHDNEGEVLHGTDDGAKSFVGVEQGALVDALQGGEGTGEDKVTGKEDPSSRVLAGHCPLFQVLQS